MADKKTILVKALALPERESLSPDVKVYSNDLIGKLLSTDFSQTTPLGAYPKPSSQWIDEGGKAHFKGDGHNH